MQAEFQEQFNALLDKYAEMLTGQAAPEMVEKVKIWALYNHIHKTMPPLASHWNQTHPEAKAEIRRLFEEIRELNNQVRSDGPHAGSRQDN